MDSVLGAYPDPAIAKKKAEAKKAAEAKAASKPATNTGGATSGRRIL